MIHTDYHVHTVYSHGKCTVEQVAEIAFNKGLKAVSISEHGKGNIFYGVSDNGFLDLKGDIDAVNEKYEGKLKMLLGIEADFLGNGKADIPPSIDFDVILIGYHRGIMPSNKFAANALRESFFSKGDAEKNTDEILRTFDNYPKIFAMTHPNEYIRVNINRLSREAADRGILLEINNRHLTLSKDELMICAENGAEFIISSDGHSRDEICCFDRGIALASEAGVLDRVKNYSK